MPVPSFISEAGRERTERLQREAEQRRIREATTEGERRQREEEARKAEAERQESARVREAEDARRTEQERREEAERQERLRLRAEEIRRQTVEGLRREQEAREEQERLARERVQTEESRRAREALDAQRREIEARTGETTAAGQVRAIQAEREEAERRRREEAERSPYQIVEPEPVEQPPGQVRIVRAPREPVQETPRRATPTEAARPFPVLETTTPQPSGQTTAATVADIRGGKERSLPTVELTPGAREFLSDIEKRSQEPGPAQGSRINAVVEKFKTLEIKPEAREDPAGTARDIGITVADMFVPGLWVRNIKDMSPAQIALNVGLDALFVIPAAKIAAPKVRSTVNGFGRAAADAARASTGTAAARAAVRETAETGATLIVRGMDIGDRRLIMDGADLINQVARKTSTPQLEARANAIKGAADDLANLNPKDKPAPPNIEGQKLFIDQAEAALDRLKALKTRERPAALEKKLQEVLKTAKKQLKVQVAEREKISTLFEKMKVPSDAELPARIPSGALAPKAPRTRPSDAFLARLTPKAREQLERQLQGVPPSGKRPPATEQPDEGRPKGDSQVTIPTKVPGEEPAPTRTPGPGKQPETPARPVSAPDAPMRPTDTPAPERPGIPTPTPVRTVTPRAPVRAPQPLPPEPRQAPIPEPPPSRRGEPSPEPISRPEPSPEPRTSPEPEPAPKPVPTPTAKAEPEPTPAPKPTPRTQPEPSPTPAKRAATRTDTTTATKAPPRGPRFRLPDDTVAPEGQYPRILTWEQGSVRYDLDIDTGARSASGITPTGRTPRETLRVTAYDATPPQDRVFDLGFETVHVSPTAIRFRQIREKARRHPADRVPRMKVRKARI